MMSQTQQLSMNDIPDEGGLPSSKQPPIQMQQLADIVITQVVMHYASNIPQATYTPRAGEMPVQVARTI